MRLKEGQVRAWLGFNEPEARIFEGETSLETIAKKLVQQAMAEDDFEPETITFVHIDNACGERHLVELRTEYVMKFETASVRYEGIADWYTEAHPETPEETIARLEAENKALRAAAKEKP